jgi:hypothetical protein
MKTSIAKDIAALEVRVVAAVACAAEGSTTVERRFADFCTKLVRDFVPLCEVDERNIRSLGDICSPLPGAAPSVEDYIR